VKDLRDQRDFLIDIVNACRSIIRFVEGMTFEQYLSDEKTRFAVMRGYEIMGEAVRHIEPDFQKANNHIPWSKMAAVRNRVVHGYFGIDDATLFSAIDEDLKPLLPQLEKLIPKL